MSDLVSTTSSGRRGWSSSVREALAPWIQRYLDWLDWDEVAALVQGQGADGRGALLNGLLDYDNIDNIARFLAASGLGSPGYDPVALARGLTLSAGVTTHLAMR